MHPKIKEAIKLKEELYEKWRTSPTRENYNAYYKATYDAVELEIMENEGHLDFMDQQIDNSIMRNGG